MKIGIVCRFQPPHWIHTWILAACAARADELVVGIGSPARVDARNPFPLGLRRDCLEALSARWPEVATRIVAVPDLGDGPRWAAALAGLLGPLDRFVSANGYVRSLVGERYRLVHPRELLAPAERAPISGSRVRLAMARGEGWVDLVPPEVAALLRERGAVESFRRQHGLATTCDAARSGAPLPEEGAHVRVG